MSCTGKWSFRSWFGSGRTISVRRFSREGLLINYPVSQLHNNIFIIKYSVLLYYTTVFQQVTHHNLNLYLLFYFVGDGDNENKCCNTEVIPPPSTKIRKPQKTLKRKRKAKTPVFFCGKCRATISEEPKGTKKRALVVTIVHHDSTRHVWDS